MIPNIGPVEIVIVLVVVLAVFGTKRIPELGSSLGRGISSFRKGIDGRDEPAAAVAAPAELGEEPGRDA
jgi:sec-independent protein translocase protein TatA